MGPNDQRCADPNASTDRRLRSRWSNAPNTVFRPIAFSQSLIVRLAPRAKQPKFARRLSNKGTASAGRQSTHLLKTRYKAYPTQVVLQVAP